MLTRIFWFYTIEENLTILCVDTILHALQFTHAVMFTKDLRIMPSRVSIRRTEGRRLQVGKRIFALIVLRTICKNYELLRSSFSGVKSRRFFSASKRDCDRHTPSSCAPWSCFGAQVLNLHTVMEILTIQWHLKLCLQNCDVACGCQFSSLATLKTRRLQLQFKSGYVVSILVKGLLVFQVLLHFCNSHLLELCFQIFSTTKSLT